MGLAPVRFSTAHHTLYIRTQTGVAFRSCPMPPSPFPKSEALPILQAYQAERYAEAREASLRFLETHPRHEQELARLLARALAKRGRAVAGIPHFNRHLTHGTHVMWDPMLARCPEDGSYLLAYLCDTAEAFWSRGHLAIARSPDLVEWESLGVPIRPDETCSHRSAKILAGSLHWHDGLWHLFFGASGKGAQQHAESLHLATSPDGTGWKIQPEPLLLPDPRWYGGSRLRGREIDQIHFRDPWLMRDRADGLWHLFYTAGAKGRQDFEPFAGAIGHAIAEKIDGPYTATEPVLFPRMENGEGIHFELERPQILHRDGRYLLLYSAPAVEHWLHPDWLARISGDEAPLRQLTRSTLFLYESESLTGPFLPAHGEAGSPALPILEGSPFTGMYGSNIIEDPSGQSFLYGWYTDIALLEINPRFPIHWHPGSGLPFIVPEALTTAPAAVAPSDPTLHRGI